MDAKTVPRQQLYECLQKTRKHSYRKKDMKKTLKAYKLIPKDTVRNVFKKSRTKQIKTSCLFQEWLKYLFRTKS